MKKKQKNLGILITLIGGCLWGLSGACGQFLFSYRGATADWLVPIRLLAAGFLLTLFYLFKSPADCRRIWSNPKSAFSLICYGLLGLMLCQYSYFKAIEYSNAGTATVLQYVSPVLIMLVMCIWERRFPHFVHMTAILLALTGVFLLATHGQPGQIVISSQALFWGLFSAGTVVLYNLLPRSLMRTYSTPFLLGWAMLIGGIALCLLRKPWQYHPILDLPAVLCLCAIILLGTIGAFSLYMQGMKLIGPEKASLYACIEPVAATLFSVFWLKSSFAVLDIAGFFCIVSTLSLITFFGKKAEQTTDSLP